MRVAVPEVHIEIVDRPRLRVAAVRHIGSYSKISDAFTQLGELAASADLALLTAQMIAVYHDDPSTTPEAELRSDAGLVIDDGSPIPSTLVEVIVPAGRYAQTIHKGSYKGLAETWKQLLEQSLPSSGYRMATSASYELYLNDPRQAPEDQLRTAIYAPVH